MDKYLDPQKTFLHLLGKGKENDETRLSKLDDDQKYFRVIDDAFLTY